MLGNYYILGIGWSLSDVKGPKDAQNVFDIIKVRDRQIFLSGTRNSTPHSWMWPDGTRVDQFDNFVTGQDNHGGEYCLGMYSSDNSSFRDLTCTGAYASAVLCQNEGISYKL